MKLEHSKVTNLKQHLHFPTRKLKKKSYYTLLLVLPPFPLRQFRKKDTAVSLILISRKKQAKKKEKQKFQR